MSNIEKLVKEILINKIPINVVSLVDNQVLGYEVSGFYKSGTVKVYELNNKLYCLGRYDTLDELDNENPFDSLIDINYKWWLSSKNRYEGWSSPDSHWLKLLIDKNYVTEIIETKKTYK